MNKKHVFSLLIILGISKVMWSQELTIPPKNYVDSINTKNSVKRINDEFPLSDQKNSQKWKLLKVLSDEFDLDKLNENIWYSNNPKWQGRPPTFFHGSNVSLEDDELVIRVNQHGNDTLPKDFTHSTGFIKSKINFFMVILRPNANSWMLLGFLVSG